MHCILGGSKQVAGQAAPLVQLSQATRKVLDELHAYDDLIERCKALGDRDLQAAAVNRKHLSTFRHAVRFCMFRTRSATGRLPGE
jgi:hypothetical protein